MLHRRDLLKGAVVSVAGGAAFAQADPPGPFANPTARFQAGAQDELPFFAFQKCLPIPPTPRPLAVGDYEAIAGKPVFGPGDPVPIGDVFHGVAREWDQSPPHWRDYGCTCSARGAASWAEKREAFGTFPSAFPERPGEDKLVHNWGEYPIKVYKQTIDEHHAELLPGRPPARMYGYSGMTPGPTLKFRHGQPAIVRYQNNLEAEMSVHLHGAHSPSHSDGFPSFYVFQGQSRDYFYPNICPLLKPVEGLSHPGAGGSTPKGYLVDLAEAQSTMWYHDHAMDATGFNVAKGLAGMAIFYSEAELKLVAEGTLPGLGPESCKDPELCRRLEGQELIDAGLEDPDNPGFYKYGKEPYHNPYDIPLVLQDKVIDPATGQIAYDNTGHNGYLGDTFLVNGVPYPYLEVQRRKYRFRVLNGANARVFRLRVLSEEDWQEARRDGLNRDEMLAAAKPYLRIGKDSWLWPEAHEVRDCVVAMAARADLVIDFKALSEGLPPGEEATFYLVNTMPQKDGRGPKQELQDPGDPRVLPLPFETPEHPMPELNRPITLMKFIVRGPAPEKDACVEHGTPLIGRGIIHDQEIHVVREFIFERGKGAWQINGRFYDPFIANATPRLDTAEEWVFRNGGGGWWHPIHVHLESHQIVSYEKDFEADEVIDPEDPPARTLIRPPAPPRPPGPPGPTERAEGARRLEGFILAPERQGLHDTQVLGPNTVVRVRFRMRTFNGPFVFHCHNLEHEDMRMMFNFEPVPHRDDRPHDPDVAPDARTHGNDVTWQGDPAADVPVLRVGELPWEYPPIPKSPVTLGDDPLIEPRPKAVCDE